MIQRPKEPKEPKGPKGPKGPKIKLYKGWIFPLMKGQLGQFELV